MIIRTGLETVLHANQNTLRGARIGLLAHQASVDRAFAHAADLLEAHVGAQVVRLFAPEHGVAGGRQDMVPVDESRDPVSGRPVVSLYGATEDSLTPKAEHLAGLDALVIDLADVGARYYTFVATAIRCLAPAARQGVRVVVLDRPNPLGGAIEGSLVAPAHASFVGEEPIPVRHGMTIGELCRFAAERRRIDIELEVVPVLGWERQRYWDETGLPWIAPSPNMPTLDTALVYPGGCLFEGTNLSEGRGTTRPFELVGAPWLDARSLAARLTALELPGVVARPVVFVPAFHKHAQQACGGVHLHVVDRAAFRPVLTGLAVVAAARSLAPDAFRWRTEPYEFVADRLAFDLLAGGVDWRQSLERGADPREIARDWSAHERAFAESAEAALLYGPLDAP